jgi:hypothetical protein
VVVPVVPAVQEAETGGSLEPTSSRATWQHSKIPISKKKICGVKGGDWEHSSVIECLPKMCKQEPGFIPSTATKQNIEEKILNVVTERK